MELTLDQIKEYTDPELVMYFYKQLQEAERKGSRYSLAHRMNYQKNKRKDVRSYVALATLAAILKIEKEVKHGDI